MGRVERWLCDQCRKLGESDPPGSSNLPKGWEEITIQFQDPENYTRVVCSQGCAKAFANELIVRHFELGEEIAEVGVR